jgi:hypothetical protein
VIVSSGYPFTGHVLGYLLKRVSNVKWLAEYGDPWAFNPGSRSGSCRRSLDTLLESTLLQKVDGVTVTTEATRLAYLQHYPFLRPDRIWTLQSGYSPAEYSRAPTVTSSRFRLVYTGIFNQGIRSPEQLFRALTQLTDLDIEFVHAGPVAAHCLETIRSLGLDGTQSLGNVARSQALGLQKGASLLVLIGFQTPLLLPMKTLEYIGAKRPILCIRNCEHDIAADLTVRLRRGIVAQNTPGSIAAAIREAYNLWKCGRLDPKFHLDDLPEFTWSHAGATLHSILTGL